MVVLLPNTTFASILFGKNFLDVVLADLLTDCGTYDFCTCNPLFFADKSEIVQKRSRTGSRPQPNSVCTGPSLRQSLQGEKLRSLAE